MRKLSVLLMLVALGGWGFLSAQETGTGILYSKYRSFRIPFNAGSGRQRLKQLQLYVSADQGRTWQPNATASPDQEHFVFLTDRDGYYWFTVQTLDVEGRAFPPAMDGATPTLKVVVDTQPPSVQVQSLPPRAGEVGVAWELRDENPDALPDAVRLEYRPPGSPSWLPLPRRENAAQLYWAPEGNGPLEVKVSARDRAGNWGEATTTVGANQGFGGFNDRPAAGNGANELPPNFERRLVNSKRITLNYELKEVGPSGVSAVELWYTQDGRGWSKYPHKVGDDGQRGLASFDVSGEGLYGITLVARSGVGLGERPPQIGDRPQVWIEVDLTRPAVHIQSVAVGQGKDKGKLSVSWAARDKNLTREPIKISYAENTLGPWTAMVENQPNTGRYIWSMPERVPYQFYVKVEAADQAGNVGEAVTEQMVKVDLSLPKVRILNVEPGR